MQIRKCNIKNSTRINAPIKYVWQQITEVDIAAFQHPMYLRALGIPKPLRAEVVEAGVGGVRIAFFNNN